MQDNSEVRELVPDQYESIDWDAVSKVMPVTVGLDPTPVPVALYAQTNVFEADIPMALGKVPKAY